MNTSIFSRVTLALVLVASCGGATAWAQVFGTFSWQMQPYCNVVTLTITQIPGGFTIDGNDNQCGAAKLAGAAGMALINPDGTVGLEFTIVTAPAGKALSVSASLNPATGSGPWTDSVGNSGTLALGANAAGLARPFPTSGLGAASVTTTEIAPGAVGGADINTAEVQARVTGTCPAGAAVTGVAANGTVTCTAPPPNVQFRATAHAQVSVANSTLTDVTGWIVAYNDGGGTYSSGAGTYVVPVSGLYEISSLVRWRAFPAVGGGFAGLYITVNGAFIETTSITPETSINDFHLHQVSTTRKLSAGDVVKTQVYQTTGAATTVGPGSASQSSFTVTQLR